MSKMKNEAIDKMNNPKVSIIIPVYNKLEMTHECINSIIRNTSTKFDMDYEIIVIDNGSKEMYTNESLTIIKIRNETNLGFPMAVNQGIKRATGDIICILNNDTILTPDCLERLVYHLKDYDMVSPCTNYILEPYPNTKSGVQQVLVDNYENKNELNEVANKFYEDNKYDSEPFHRLVFFCVIIKREVLEKVGLLNEVFSPGNFEDDDYCLRAIEKGFKLGIAKDVYIHHHGSVTHKLLNIEYHKLLAKNKKIFDGLWSDEKYKELMNKNNLIKFNGEKAIPLDRNTPKDVMEEHWARYYLASQFVEGKKVLDVACGSGYGSDLLSRYADQVTGGDICENTIKYCNSKYKKDNLKYEVCDIRDMEYDDKSFDVVISYETIEHITECEKFLDKVKRILTDDGKLVISTPIGGACGNKYHLSYFQKDSFRWLLKNYFNNVTILYQVGKSISNISISKNYEPSFSGEYIIAVCDQSQGGI